MVRVKICCISTIEEAELAIQYGASALGLVGKMPSGPGVIDDESIQKIAYAVPPPVSTFLLTSETSAGDIVLHYRKVNTTTIQIVDALEDYQYVAIRRELPHVKIVQVIHVLDETSIDEACHAAEFADALLLDSGNPKLKIKELGGTGRTHDWLTSRKITDLVKVPVFLAGGLNASNVQKALDIVRPFGVDLCSSVRTNGHLDENKLAQFFRALHG